MDPFEHELKARLARHEPSVDFTARVMASVQAAAGQDKAPIEFRAPRPSRRPWALRWATVGGLAASLAFGFLAMRYQRAERRAAEQAEAQLMESLSVAGMKVSQARDRVWGAPRGD